MKKDMFLIGFFSGCFLLTVVLSIFNGGARYESASEFGDCATGQKPSLRDTADTAVYTVRFKDGKATEFKCAKQAIK